MPKRVKKDKIKKRKKMKVIEEKKGEKEREKTGVEKRKHPRLNAKLIVQYRWDDKKNMGHLINISMGGACIEIKESIPKGTIIEVDIPVPKKTLEQFSEQEPMKSRAEVVYCGKGQKKDSKKETDSSDKYRIGLKFLDISPEKKEKIKEFFIYFLVLKKS